MGFVVLVCTTWICIYGLAKTDISLPFNFFAFSFYRSNVTKPRQQELTMLQWMTPRPYTTICITLIVNVQGSPKKWYITTTTKVATKTCVTKVRTTKLKITVMGTSNESRRRRRTGRKISISRRTEGDLLIEGEAIRIDLWDKVEGTENIQKINR